MISNLGEIISKFAQNEADTIIMHEDVNAWNAPSECHKDVARSHHQSYLKLCKDLEITLDEAIEEGEFRTSPNAIHRAYDKCIAIILKRDNPFN